MLQCVAACVSSKVADLLIEDVLDSISDAGVLQCIAVCCSAMFKNNNQKIVKR